MTATEYMEEHRDHLELAISHAIIQAFKHRAADPIRFIAAFLREEEVLAQDKAQNRDASVYKDWLKSDSVSLPLAQAVKKVIQQRAPLFTRYLLGTALYQVLRTPPNLFHPF